MPRRRVPRRSSALLLTATLLTLAACSAATEPPTQGMARLVVQANVSATSIATMVIKVSAPDIAPTLVFNLPVNGGKADGSIEVPAGSDRKLQFEAYNEKGVKTHEGERTIATVNPGDANGVITVTLNPIPGEQPVTVTLGSYAVSITGTPKVAVGGETQLTATVKDAEGNTVDGAAVQWATANPAIATVSSTGLVTGQKVGSVQIMATYKGAGGDATITVE